MFSPGPFSCPPELDGYRHGGLVEGDADQRRNVGPVKRPRYLRLALFAVPLAIGAVIGAGQHAFATGVAFGGGFGIIAAGLVKSGRS